MRSEGLTGMKVDDDDDDDDDANDDEDTGFEGGGRIGGGKTIFCEGGCSSGRMRAVRRSAGPKRAAIA